MNGSLKYYENIKNMSCGVPPSDLSRNMDINHRGELTGIYDADPSSRILHRDMIRENWGPRGMASLRQANAGNYMKKYSLPLNFTFYLNRDTSVLELFPVVMFQWKGFSMRSVLTHLSQSKPSKKLLDCGRKIRYNVHIDIYHCKPKLMS